MDREDDSRAPSPERREFLDVAVTGAAAAVGIAAAYPAPKLLEPAGESSPTDVGAGKVGALARGAPKTVLLGQRPVLVLRGADGAFRAFLAICPHLSCVVRFASESGLIECACHGGRFSTEGRNIAGPPPRPLEAMRVEIADGNVVVSVV